MTLDQARPELSPTPPPHTPLRTESTFMRRIWIDESIDVAASPAQVFAAMRELDAWPRWVPEMAAIWGADAQTARVGKTFLMVLKFPVLQRVILPCTIYRWDDGCLEWGGGPAWSGVRHRFELTSLGQGRTRIRHSEHATGVLSLFFRPFEGFAYGFDHAWNEALSARFTPR